MVLNAPSLEILQLRAELVAARDEAGEPRVKAINADLEALNAWLELMNEKMRRDKYGARSERNPRLLDQLEITFEDLEADAPKTSS